MLHLICTFAAWDDAMFFPEAIGLHLEGGEPANEAQLMSPGNFSQSAQPADHRWTQQSPNEGTGVVSQRREPYETMNCMNHEESFCIAIFGSQRCSFLRLSSSIFLLFGKVALAAWRMQGLRIWWPQTLFRWSWKGTNSKRVENRPRLLQPLLAAGISCVAPVLCC